MKERTLTELLNKAHNIMRNIDGLQPQEAFDEFLKYLFFKESNEKESNPIRVQNSLLKDGTFGPQEERLANEMNQALSNYLKMANSWTTQLWDKRKFALSDHALLTIHEVLQDVEWSKLPLDIRSNSVKGFLRPELRKGLGIFLTPDEIVQFCIELVRPEPGSRVCDPACGSGTFLLETVSYWRRQDINSTAIVYGIEKNPRMYSLADLNLAHDETVTFHGLHADSLTDVPGTLIGGEEVGPNFFDYIFTNPPFGVYLDNRNREYDKFKTFHGDSDKPLMKQQSEYVFVEQCLRLLKPGGTLGIVLPKGAISNQNQQSKFARSALQSLGYITAVFALPPETFATAGTQTTTAFLLIRKYKNAEEAQSEVRIQFSNIKNVGFDSTGRERTGCELPAIADEYNLLPTSKKKTSKYFTPLAATVKGHSFEALRDLLADNQPHSPGVCLGDVATLVRTGRTPARKDYSDSGLFLIKVGNLSGTGINWIARDRNFIDTDQREKREKAGLLVQPMDILLTSSAHSAVYIGKKVDIVDKIPSWVGGEASLVGEVMLIRPDTQKIDPFALLGFLRSPSTKDTLQTMTRGQTAHLHAKDLMGLRIPKIVMQPTNEVKKLSKLMRSEVELSQELNEITYKSSAMAEAFF